MIFCSRGVKLHSFLSLVTKKKKGEVNAMAAVTAVSSLGSRWQEFKLDRLIWLCCADDNRV